jgi:hypothetical protein
LDVAVPAMSTGSTEPKAILLSANEILGLNLDQRLSKPKLAEAICSAALVPWDRSCWSAGSTVTSLGLTRVLRAVEILTGGIHDLDLTAP